MKLDDFKDPENVDTIIDKILSSRHYQKSSPIFRGSNLLYRNGVDVIELSIPKEGIRKKPVDTPSDIHNKINRISEQKLGYKLRNGLFCSLAESVASCYGDSTIVVFPLDNAKVFYSEIFADVYSDLFEAIEFLYDEYIEDFERDYVEDNPVATDEDIEYYIEENANSLEEFIDTQVIRYVDSIRELEKGEAIRREKELIVFGDIVLTTQDFAKKHRLL